MIVLELDRKIVEELNWRYSKTAAMIKKKFFEN
jgi:hypothetical protein